METVGTRRNWMAWWIAAALVASCTGCQLDVGGQTLPSPWWYTDDVQYFPPGPEFKLSREAAAMQAAKSNADLSGQPNAGAPAGGAPGAAPPPAPGAVAPLPGGAAAPLPAGAAGGVMPAGT
ncbi:MAG TPA: hypothetical protein VG433_00545 [Pirellulales bacterium]|jgi:hypothetical protein|nr:hypothetical protein [Pirellulales bacterium]